MNNLRKKIGGLISQLQNQGRKQQKIDDRTAEEGGGDIQPDLSVPDGNDEEKQADSDQKPEEQVQNRAQQADRHPDPQNPEQIVNQADGQAQHESAGKNQRLVGHMVFHLSGRAGPAGRAFRPVLPRTGGRQWRPPPSGRLHPG